MSSNSAATSNSSNTDVLSLFPAHELTTPVTKLKSNKKSKNSSASPSNGRSSTPTPTWKERSNALDALDEATTAPSPVVTQLDEKDIATFATGRPLVDEPDYTVCKYCKKPIIKSAAVAHIKACLKAKAERTKKRKEEKAAAKAEKDGGSVGGGSGGGGGGDGEAAGTSTSTGTGKTGGKAVEGKKSVKKTKKDDGTKGKKRKADEAKLPKESKAKKKKEKQEKPAPKPKAPVDVEKQCGVQLANGALCARSLTCKSHSMGLKRGVLGRSQPYDILLAAYQKKNQAKQQKAAINAGGPPPEEIEANALPVDSDEETELVMQAIARHQPQPLVTQLPILVRKKSQYVRMREMMASALRPMHNGFNGSGGAGSGGGLENGLGLAAALGSQMSKQNSSSGGQMKFQSPAPPSAAGAGASSQNPSRKSSLNVAG